MTTEDSQDISHNDSGLCEPPSSNKSGLDMDLSKNRGTPKSSILIRFSIINHPFWDTTIFGNTYIIVCLLVFFKCCRSMGCWGCQGS